MKLPRDISGVQLARRLKPYGYEESRQVGSHLQLRSQIMGYSHNVTVPNHRALRVGTLARIVTNVAAYLEKDRDALALELFA